MCAIGCLVVYIFCATVMSEAQKVPTAYIGFFRPKRQISLQASPFNYVNEVEGPPAPEFIQSFLQNKGISRPTVRRPAPYSIGAVDESQQRKYPTRYPKSSVFNSNERSRPARGSLFQDQSFVDPYNQQPFAGTRNPPPFVGTYTGQSALQNNRQRGIPVRSLPVEYPRTHQVIERRPSAGSSSNIYLDPSVLNAKRYPSNYVRDEALLRSERQYVNIYDSYDGGAPVSNPKPLPIGPRIIDMSQRVPDDYFRKPAAERRRIAEAAPVSQIMVRSLPSSPAAQPAVGVSVVAGDPELIKQMPKITKNLLNLLPF